MKNSLAFPATYALGIYNACTKQNPFTKVKQEKGFTFHTSEHKILAKMGQMLQDELSNEK